MSKKPWHRIKVAWRALTKDDYYMISLEPPEYPFTLLIGNIEVIYHDPRP